MTEPASQHISGILALIIEQMKDKQSISLKEIIATLGERVFGMSILLFCIPNVLPIPNVAGLSAFTGIPIGLLGLQLVIGRSHPWLPESLKNKRFSGQRVGAMLEQAIPYIRKIEVLLHPRLQVMSEAPMQRPLGVVFVLLAIVMSLPIPFGNFMPGLAMALIAIGLLERDGLLILFGLMVGAATVALMVTVTDTIISVLRSFFG